MIDIDIDTRYIRRDGNGFLDKDLGVIEINETTGTCGSQTF
jgi:hypothetical protein